MSQFLAKHLPVTPKTSRRAALPESVDILAILQKSLDALSKGGKCKSPSTTRALVTQKRRVKAA